MDGGEDDEEGDILACLESLGESDADSLAEHLQLASVDDSNIEKLAAAVGDFDASIDALMIHDIIEINEITPEPLTHQLPERALARCTQPDQDQVGRIGAHHVFRSTITR